jgi:uncharacterized protein (TIGR03083 family)
MNDAGVKLDIAAAYRAGRERVTDLVSGLSRDEALTPVPTCPEWTVHDVVAHITGVCTDILTGNLDGVATDPWTSAQVAARRDRPLGEILQEWEEAAPQVENIAPAFPGRVGTQWVFDMTTHEHDIRLALNQPGARDSDAVIGGVGFLVDVRMRPFVGVRGLGPLVVRVGHQSWRIGSTEPAEPDEDALTAALGRASEAALMGGEVLPDPPESLPAVAELKTTAFELFRAGTGRRSENQIRNLGWSGDPEPYLPIFGSGPFTISSTDITE